MQRRDFITLFGSAAAAWPLAARAQQTAGRVYRVGYFALGAREQQIDLSKAFEDGLRSLGYRVGENVVIEYRFADGQLDRLPPLSADLVRLGVDVIVTSAHQSTVAAMKATTTIPIVMTNSVDPVGAGLVVSLVRPGGNVTGFGVDAGDEIFGKRLELLKETLPNLLRVGILWNPDFAPNRSRLASMSEATMVLGLTLVSAEARGLDAFEQAFATMVRERAQAFVVLGEPVLFGNRGQIAAMAIRERLPAIASAVHARATDPNTRAVRSLMIAILLLFRSHSVRCQPSRAPARTLQNPSNRPSVLRRPAYASLTGWAPSRGGQPSGHGMDAMPWTGADLCTRC